MTTLTHEVAMVAGTRQARTAARSCPLDDHRLTPPTPEDIPMATITASTPARAVRTRRIEFEYPVEELPRHYVSVQGERDLVMSHVVTTLSSLFPEGEDFFVQSVRNYRDRITDPELKQQVGGFIGQEAIHGREHRSFNERLQELGYPTRTTDRMVAFGLGVGQKVLPKRTQLAITAALEHYTATLAEVLLTDPEAQAMLDVDEVRSLFLWHALEESEHKAVAFDVYQAVCGKHWVRAGVMNAVTIGFFLVVIGHTAHSLLLDPTARRHPLRVGRSLSKLRHSPWLTRKVRRRIRDYNRRDFHPDDHDSSALVEEWRTRLFGDDGTLVERLRSA